MSKAGVSYLCKMKNSATTNYTLDQMIGKGGEGEVYGVMSHPELVAKIFFQNKPGREEKLNALLKLNVQSRIQGIVRIAMPEGLLYANGALVGYVMPRVDASLKLFQMWRENDNDRDRFFPNYGWHHAVKIAYNLAEVIDYLHKCGIVVGDFNSNNFVIDPQNGGRPILVDCDSFDIRDPDTNRHFPCEVVSAEMAAPEILLAGNVANATFSKASDNFSLAIQIFRLLMNNQDPFGSQNIGNYKPSSSSVAMGNTHIIRGECVYVRYVPGKSIPPNLLSFDVLPSDIQKLFDRAFHYDEVTVTYQTTIDKRPSAEEWKNTLLKYAKDDSFIKTCSSNPKHKYSNHLLQCPWCDLEAKRAKATPPPPPSPFNQKKKRRTVRKSPVQRPPFIAGQGRRDAMLYYTLFVIFGIAGGFMMGRTVERLSDYHVSEEAAIVIISTIGVIYGLIVAYYTKDRYINAINSIPWLLLTLSALLLPAMVVASVVIVVMGIISFLIFLTVIGFCCSRICK